MTNNAGASIEGGQYGIRANIGLANVTNSGSITGTGITAAGIYAGTNAIVTNNAGASIAGGANGIIAFGGGSSVFNAGTISGGTAAIQFAGTGNTLTLAQGSVISGIVLGTGSDTFQLGGTGAATFDVSSLGPAAQYQGFGTFNKIDSSVWTLTGTSTYAGSVNVNGGTLTGGAANTFSAASATRSTRRHPRPRRLCADDQRGVAGRWHPDQRFADRRRNVQRRQHHWPRRDRDGHHHGRNDVRERNEPLYRRDNRERRRARCAGLDEFVVIDS